MNPHATELEKLKAVSDFAYTLNMIPLSLYNGNTNLIGRNAWNGLIGEIVKGVSNFVNQLNLEFRNDPNNPRNTVNPNDHPRFLHEDLPTLVNTHVRNNNFHISIGLVTSSLDSHDVVNAHNAALGDAVLDDVPVPSDSYVPRQINMGAGPAITAQRLESAIDVLSSTQLPSVPMGGARRRVPSQAPAPSAADAPPSRPYRSTRNRPASVPQGAPTTQEKVQHLQAKELLRTLSSAMEKPYWDTCQKAGTDPCIMPNIGRTPDITVIVTPDNYTQNVTYPIFIGEILGRKEQSTLTQRYAGYNACMQSLVFVPRAYYWEIKTTKPNLYILNRDPAHGRINANMKTYNLVEKAEFKEMLDDLCFVFLDELIYLRPLTYISSQCLRNKEYKDFLSKPPGLDSHIENQCWHLFVPKYNCQGINAVPDNFVEGIDHEDPEKEFSSEVPADHWPRVQDIVNGNLVLKVDNWNIAEGTFGDIAFCHAYRNNIGTLRIWRMKTLWNTSEKMQRTSQNELPLLTLRRY